jgi:toxin FitB
MHYLLDAVTISELRRDDRKMHPGVRNWQMAIRQVWLSVITLNELRYGMQKVASNNPPFASILAVWYERIITATAKIHTLTLATRNTADFHDCGIQLVNPWEYQG